MKKCLVCKEYLDEGNFYKNSGSNDGLMTRCKPCFKRIRKEQRAKKASDPEWRKKFNAKNTEYRHKAGKMGQLYTAAQNRAYQKQIEFNITKDDIVIPDVCPVLGIPIEAGTGRISDEEGNNKKLVGARFSSPSVDRIDNSKGYVKGNVRVISWRANYLKNNASLEELIMIGEDARRSRAVIRQQFTLLLKQKFGVTESFDDLENCSILHIYNGNVECGWIIFDADDNATFTRVKTYKVEDKDIIWSTMTNSQELLEKYNLPIKGGWTNC